MEQLLPLAGEERGGGLCDISFLHGQFIITNWNLNHWSDLEHTLQDPLKHSHFTWDLEHTLLLKSDSSSTSLSRTPNAWWPRYSVGMMNLFCSFPTHTTRNPFRTTLVESIELVSVKERVFLRNLMLLLPLLQEDVELWLPLRWNSRRWEPVAARWGWAAVAGKGRSPPKRRRFDFRNIKTTSFWCWKKNINRTTGRTAGSINPISVQPIYGLIDRTGPEPWPTGPVFKTMVGTQIVFQ